MMMKTFVRNNMCSSRVHVTYTLVLIDARLIYRLMSHGGLVSVDKLTFMRVFV